MGLTIHWSFQGPPLKADARAVIEQMRQRALDLPFESVSEIGHFHGLETIFDREKDDKCGWPKRVFPVRWRLGLIVGHTEIVGKEIREGIENPLGIRPFRLENDFGPLWNFEHDEFKNPVGVGFLVAITDLDLGRKAIDGLDDGPAGATCRPVGWFTVNRRVRRVDWPCGRSKHRIMGTPFNQVWDCERGVISLLQLLTACHRRTAGPKSSPSQPEIRKQVPLTSPSQHHEPTIRTSVGPAKSISMQTVCRLRPRD